MVVAVFIAVVMLVGVLIPICTEAGTTQIDVENTGTLCKKIGAGYSATINAAEVEAGAYAMIGETVSITGDGTTLHITGIGVDAESASVTVAYDGSKVTINGTEHTCAWAFVPDASGTFRYGEGGASMSIGAVYGVGTYENVYYSVHGADEAVIGAIA